MCDRDLYDLVGIGNDNVMLSSYDCWVEQVEVVAHCFLIIYLLFHSFFSFLLLSLLGFPHFTNTVNLLLTISIFFRLWVYHSITIYVSCISFFHFWYLLLHAHAHAHSRIETCELAAVNVFNFFFEENENGRYFMYLSLCWQLIILGLNVHCILVFFVEPNRSSLLQASVNCISIFIFKLSNS